MGGFKINSIIITIEESPTQLISGIPMLISLKTDIPATIFYTINGDNPTTFSSVYLEPIILPTINCVKLKILAISGNDTGYIEKIYRTNNSDLTRSRRIDGYGAGVVIDAYEVENLVTDGYSLNENYITDVATRASDYNLQDLDIKYSSNLKKNLISPPVEQLEKESAVDWNASSPNNNNASFNAKSLYINIDGRDGYQDQIASPSVIINRPWSDTRNSVKYLQGKEMYEPTPYFSGGHVRSHYNYEKGIVVSYYFDHNETRWIRSIQNFDKTMVPKGVGLRRQTGGPLVFKWVYNKRSGI